MLSVAAAMVIVIVIGVACYNRKRIKECCTKEEGRHLTRNGGNND